MHLSPAPLSDVNMTTVFSICPVHHVVGILNRILCGLTKYLPNSFIFFVSEHVANSIVGRLFRLHIVDPSFEGNY